MHFQTIFDRLAETINVWRGRPRTLPETTCRHPPREQHILVFEDRVIHACERCGRVLNRRGRPLEDEPSAMTMR